MAHGHDVMNMMAGKAYASKQALVDDIIKHFGSAERFQTCSAEGMTAAELVDFLAERGKFMPAEGGTFTADPSKRCNHEG